MTGIAGATFGGTLDAAVHLGTGNRRVATLSRIPIHGPDGLVRSALGLSLALKPTR